MRARPGRPGFWWVMAHHAHSYSSARVRRAEAGGGETHGGGEVRKTWRKGKKEGERVRWENDKQEGWTQSWKRRRRKEKWIGKEDRGKEGEHKERKEGWKSQVKESRGKWQEVQEKEEKEQRWNYERTNVGRGGDDGGVSNKGRKLSKQPRQRH